MATSTTDILARLTLNGSQFSAENARIFGEMEARARDVAGRTKAAFESSYSEIQQIAQRALAMPRNASGSLDLNVTGAREAATAAEAAATAYREVAAAAEIAALKTSDNSENTRLYVQAARAAAIEAENLARAARLEADALDVLQTELNQTRSATDLVVEGNRVLNASQDGVGTASRRSGMAMMQAGQQVQDFFIQVGGGQNVMQAFIMQASQAAFVLQNTGAQASKFAAFLTGGWGTALIAAATLLTIFWDKIVGAGDAVEKATRELEKQARQTIAADKAKERFGRTIDGVVQAINEENKKLEEQNRSLEENIRLQKGAAEQRLNTARHRRNEEQNQLNSDRRELERLRGINSEAAEAAAPRLAQLEQRIADREAKLRDLDASIEKAQRDVRMAGFPLAERAARAAVDPIEAIRERYRKLEDQAKNAAKGNDQLAASLDKTLAAIYRKRDAEISAEQDRQSRERNQERRERREADRTMVLGAPVSGRISSGYGPRTAPRTTNGRRGSADHLGVDYAVPTGTTVRAGAAGVVVYTGELGGYGQVVVVDYGNGTFGQFSHLSKFLAGPGDKVASGTAIALSGATGNVTGPHLDYRVRTGARFDGERFVGGRYVDPRGRVRTGDPGDAAADYEDRQAKALAEQEEARQRIIAASEKQLSVDAESLRFLGLKVQGLDEQSTVEAEIAEKRRQYNEDMAALSDKDRAEQSKRTAGLVTQLELFRDQGAAFAALLVAAGDQTQLTDDQKKALDDANSAMLAQLEAARALATTAKDRLLLEEAIARVSGRLSSARGEGQSNSREQKRLQDEIKRDLQRDKDEQYRVEQDKIRSLADFYRDAFRSGGRSIVEDFQDEMLDMISVVAARWTLALISGQKTSLGSILSDMGATSGVGGGPGILSALGLVGGDGARGGLGDIGKVLGGKVAGKGVGGFLSSAMPYVALASVALPLVSGLFGSIFKSTKWGDATLSLQNGQVVGSGVGGNRDSTRSAALGQANSVAEGVNRLAEQLGATITGLPGITVGSWDGRARVALTSTSKPLHSKNFGNDILKDFGDDQQAAIEYAIKYAFSHSVMEGISQASRNIIASGQDVEQAIQKALLIEDIPKRLQAHLDPVGYAVDQLNAQWEKAVAALKEGGATTEQMAEAQRLYAIELEETKSAAREASADLKDFLKSIDFGSNSPYSLKQQEEMARATLQPFLDKIAAGESVNQGQYTDAAQAWLDIERQLYGSTGRFFEALNMIQDATGKAISRIDNATPIRTASDPFAEATAKNTETTNQLLDQISRQLAGNGGAGTNDDGGYLNENRLFTKLGAY